VSIRVRRASAEEVRPLRNAGLRPTTPDVRWDYDDDPDALHLAAVDAGTVVACASAYPSPYRSPAGGEPDVDDAWQLRGMVVDPGWQGRGVGAAVLAATVDAVRERSVRLMWGNARVSAVGFYRRAGWTTVGEVFRYGPAAIEHLVIVRTLD
jgi:GNAT superfamily N-acetyltransferase